MDLNEWPTLEESHALFLPDDQISVDTEYLFTNFSPFNFVLSPFSPNDKLAFEYFNTSRPSLEAKEVVTTLINRLGRKTKIVHFQQWLNYAVKPVVLEFLCPGDHEDYHNQLVVLFGTNNFKRMLSKVYENYRHELTDEMMSVIWGAIFSETKVITTFGRGLVGSEQQEMGFHSSLSLEDDKMPCLSSLVIPNQAELKVKQFAITPNQIARLGEEQNARFFKEVIGMNDEQEVLLKGIVFFHVKTDNYAEAPAVQLLLAFLKTKAHIPLAGGIQSSLFAKGTSDNQVIATGFFLYGQASRVSISCSAVKSSLMTMEDNANFSRLSESLLVPQHDFDESCSFALIFQSQHRGQRIYGTPGVEAHHLNIILPHTRLIGVTTCAEFYNNPTEALENICYQNTTVFFVVSYLHPSNNLM